MKRMQGRRRIMKEKMNKIPVFYACDDNFVKYTMVSLQSMMDHASKEAQKFMYFIPIFRKKCKRRCMLWRMRIFLCSLIM